MKKEKLTTCCICGEMSRSRWKDGKEYCRKHYMQLYHHGKILERTIYDKNEWILYDTFYECKTYDKNSNINGSIKIDIDDYEKLKKYKIYISNHNGKPYGMISDGNHKYFIHRFILNLHKEQYTINKVVDHINGDSLDNRKKNLRICKHSENMKNIRKKNKIIGVSLNRDNTYYSRIMSNYKTINLGRFKTFEEAVYARIVKEKELCGEYGPNKEYYYILDYPSPLEELRKVLSEGV